MAAHELADRQRRQIVGAQAGERTAEATDRSAHIVADESSSVMGAPLPNRPLSRSTIAASDDERLNIDACAARRRQNELREERPVTAEAQVSSQPVLLDRFEGGVLTLTLNRPERLNALNGALIEGLSAGIKRAGTDRSRRRRSYHSAGRGFCAGADLANRALLPATPGRTSALRSKTASIRSFVGSAICRSRRVRRQRPGGRGRGQYRAACASGWWRSRLNSCRRSPASASFRTLAVLLFCRDL